MHTFILSSFSVIFFYFYKVGAYIEGCVGFFFMVRMKRAFWGLHRIFQILGRILKIIFFVVVGEGRKILQWDYVLKRDYFY